MINQTSASQLSLARSHARTIVRELGMLSDAHAKLGLTNSQAHVLIELEHSTELGIVELAERLNLEKSSMSRLIDELLRKRLVTKTAGADDRRRKLVLLSDAGKELLKKVHEQANGRVARAMNLLSTREVEAMIEGLEIYARALSESKR